MLTGVKADTYPATKPDFITTTASVKSLVELMETVNVIFFYERGQEDSLPESPSLLLGRASLNIDSGTSDSLCQDA